MFGDCVFGIVFTKTAGHVDTHTHTCSRRGVYIVDSVNGDRSCCNWGKKVGQGRCHADINNLAATVRGWGEGRVGCGLKLALEVHVLCRSIESTLKVNQQLSRCPWQSVSSMSIYTFNFNLLSMKGMFARTNSKLIFLFELLQAHCTYL